MSVLRTMAYTLAFYLGSALIVATLAVLLPFGRRAMIPGAHVWARYHAWCARWLLGIRIAIEGEISREPVLYAFKHESMLETTEVLRQLRDPVVVFKRELLKIPLWGAIASRHGIIAVDREAGPGALRQLLGEAKRVRAEARSVVIFPEGTRVPHGDRPPLRAGFAGLYKVLGLPVVPVAHDAGRVWPRRGFTKHAGMVTFRYGDPIPPGLPREEIEARVHAAINVLNR